MTTLYITRHGETEWNKEGRFQGALDSKLTELGRTQATWLRDRLANVDFSAIYASTSSRAYDTAEIVKGARGVPVQKEQALGEINMGVFQGMLHKEIEALYGEVYRKFWEAPNEYEPIEGEGYDELHERVVPFIESLIEKHQGEKILIVTHGVTLKTILAHFENRPLANLWDPPYIHNTCLNVIEVKDGQPVIAIHGDTSHYPADFR